MFNLVKWAFHLGQNSERLRIAHILQESKQYIPYQERGLGNDKQEIKAEIEQRVANEVNRIVDSITEPNDFEKNRFSILFPKSK